MKAMGEQSAFAQHSLVTGGKLDLGDGERVAQMQATVHIRVGEGPEPFRVLLADLGGGQTGDVCCIGGIDLEYFVFGPARLVCLLQLD